MPETPNTRPSLLIRIRNPRDERAWTEFVELYEPVMYRLARQRGFQDADARNLTQELFVAVASAIERWAPDPARGKFRTWLFRIARNLIINVLSGQHRFPRGTGDTGMHALLDQQPAAGDDSALFDQEYKRELFVRASARVRSEFRNSTWQAFWQTAVEGKESGDVSALLGLSVGAIYIARSRVMARLRQEIERLENGDQ